MNGLTLEALLELEHKGWESLSDDSCGQFYSEIMTDKSIMILVNGMMLSQEYFPNPELSNQPWDTYSISNPRLIPISDTTAALVYYAHAQRKDQPPFKAIMTSVYSLINDETKLMLYQQTQEITHEI